jgi:hypothetical protein
MSKVTDTLRAVESVGIGIGPAAQNVMEAFKAKNKGAIVEGGFELSAGVSILETYLLSIPKYLALAGLNFTKVSNFFTTHISTVLTFSNYLYFLGGLAIFSYGCSFIKETIATARQFRFFSTDLGKRIEKNSVTNLDQLSDEEKISLRCVLPDWLFQELSSGSISPSAVLTNDQKVSAAAKSYVSKKAALHIINMVVATIAIVSAAAVMVGLASTISWALLGIMIALLIVAYIYKSGVVENSNGGFSLIKCLPAAIIPNSVLAKDAARIEKIKRNNLAKSAGVIAVTGSMSSNTQEAWLKAGFSYR